MLGKGFYWVKFIDYPHGEWTIGHNLYTNDLWLVIGDDLAIEDRDLIIGPKIEDFNNEQST